MKPKLLLRIAAGLMAFHLLGHSYGNATWTQTTEPLKQEVIRAMTTHQFAFMGATHSMGDYYTGYGYCVSVAMIFFSIVLWHASGAIPEAGRLVRKLVIATTVCLFTWSMLEFIFFFPFAAFISLLAGITSLFALIRMRNRAQKTT